MPTTPGNLRYPSTTDPVDVPGDIKKLADDVDTYKAPKSSPTFSGTITTALTTAGYVKTNSSGELSSSAAISQSDVTSLTSDLASKAPAADPTFTGVAQFPDGSASAPSITNTGDTNTGFLFPDADTVAISTGGTERVRVSSTGNVSVATTSQISRLHVSSGSSGVTSFVSGVEGATIENDDQVGLMLASPNNVSAYVFFADPQSSQAGRIQYSHASDFFAFSLQGTERLRIDSNGLITGTGTSLGAWTAYTPTLGGTGWALGDGTLEGRYIQIGKMVLYRIHFAAGSTTTFGASAAPTFTLPVTTSGTRTAALSSWVGLQDTSAGATYLGYGAYSTTVLTINKIGTDGVTAIVTSSAPFTWASTDIIRIAGAYEAA